MSAVTPRAMVVQIKKKAPLALAIRAADSRPLHVDDRDDQPKERPEEDGDVWDQACA